MKISYFPLQQRDYGQNFTVNFGKNNLMSNLFSIFAVTLIKEMMGG